MFLNARAFTAQRIDIWEITGWYSFTSLSETRWNSKFWRGGEVLWASRAHACSLEHIWGWEISQYFSISLSFSPTFSIFLNLSHSFTFILLSFSIFLSYFLLSQSFSLTFSFLNLFLLLSPFSIFLSYFLLFLSFSVYLPKTLSLTIKYLIQPFNLPSYFLNISLSAFSKGTDEAWGFLNVWEFPTCPSVGKHFLS